MRRIGAISPGVVGFFVKYYAEAAEARERVTVHIYCVRFIGKDNFPYGGVLSQINALVPHPLSLQRVCAFLLPSDDDFGVVAGYNFAESSLIQKI